MKYSAEESNERRRVYQRRSYAFVGLPLAIAGVALVGAMGWTFFQGRQVPGAVYLNLPIGLILLKVGSVLMTSRRLIFDLDADQLLAERRFLWFARSRVRRLSEFEAIGCERIEESDGEGGLKVTFLVVLRSPKETLELCRELDEAKARQLTEEIGDFLGLAREGHDAEAPELAGETESELGAAARGGHRFETASGIRAGGGGAGFLRIWGAFVGLLGLYFLLSTALGGEFNGRKDRLWEPTAIGAVMAVVGAFVFFRLKK